MTPPDNPPGTGESFKVPGASAGSHALPFRVSYKVLRAISQCSFGDDSKSRFTCLPLRSGTQA